MKTLRTIGIILILLAVSYALIPHHSASPASGSGNPIRRSVQNAYDFFVILQWTFGVVLAICLAGWAAYSTDTIPRHMVNRLLHPLRSIAARLSNLTLTDEERELQEMREVVARLRADEAQKTPNRSNAASHSEG